MLTMDLAIGILYYAYLFGMPNPSLQNGAVL
jgi:hypothetical protein